MSRTPDDPDGNLFYVIKYGVRYTAMPGWDGVLSDDDIWKTVLFIKNSGQMKDNTQPQNPAFADEINFLEDRFPEGLTFA